MIDATVTLTGARVRVVLTAKSDVDVLTVGQARQLANQWQDFATALVRAANLAELAGTLLPAGGGVGMGRG